MKLFLILSVLFTFHSVSWAQEVIEIETTEPVAEIDNVSKEWHLGMGNYFDMPNTLQKNGLGQKNDLEFWPILNGGRNYLGVFSSQTFFQWNVMFAPPQTVGSSDLTRTLLSFDFLIGRDFDIFGKLGLGISFFQQFLYYKDTGPTQTESGGSTFYRPNKMVWISQQVLTLAYAHKVYNEHFSVEAKGYIFSLWDHAERTQSYALNFLYHW